MGDVIRFNRSDRLRVPRPAEESLRDALTADALRCAGCPDETERADESREAGMAKVIPFRRPAAKRDDACPFAIWRKLHDAKILGVPADLTITARQALDRWTAERIERLRARRA